jgi:hypothetical protein
MLSLSQYVFMVQCSLKHRDNCGSLAFPVWPVVPVAFTITASFHILSDSLSPHHPASLMLTRSIHRRQLPKSSSCCQSTVRTTLTPADAVVWVSFSHLAAFLWTTSASTQCNTGLCSYLHVSGSLAHQHRQGNPGIREHQDYFLICILHSKPEAAVVTVYANWLNIKELCNLSTQCICVSEGREFDSGWGHWTQSLPWFIQPVTGSFLPAGEYCRQACYRDSFSFCLMTVTVAPVLLRWGYTDYCTGPCLTTLLIPTLALWDPCNNTMLFLPSTTKCSSIHFIWHP